MIISENKRENEASLYVNNSTSNKAPLMNFFVELPKPSASDLGSFENQINLSQNGALSQMGKINYDAASRMKAAVQAEFIETRTINLARRQIAQISDEQRPAVMSDDVTIGAHGVWSLSLGMGRENGWEFMCLQTWNGFMEPQTRLIWGVPGSGIAQISDEQGGVAIKVEVPISAHVVFPLSLGMGRETMWEFMCLQTWKKFMEP